MLSNVSGFPRIGDHRELKVATERYWNGEVSEDELRRVAQDIRRRNWLFMRDAGVDLVPSNDFSLYDQVLDTIALVGAVPPRYGRTAGAVELDTYFAMARGRQSAGVDAIATEMTKWFDSNYHYIVPELSTDTEIGLSSSKPFDEHGEAVALGIDTVPVLVGPLTMAVLARSPGGGELDRLALVERLVEVYGQVLARLGAQGARWVQLDEPVLVGDRSPAELGALQGAYRRLADVSGRPSIVVKTYFGDVGGAYPVLSGLPVEGIGLDFVRGAANAELIGERGGLGDKTLFAGVVDGRGVWINDLGASIDLMRRLQERAGDVVVSTSCSLQHVPVDLEAETRLDAEILSWLAFARQKVREVVLLARGLDRGVEAIATELAANEEALRSRRTSPRTVDAGVRERLASLTGSERRAGDYPSRRERQRRILGLPTFPTTTIGSFPQTREVRRARAAHRRGELSDEAYERQMQDAIEGVIRFQEEAGLDVLVHGEPERNDMVQYFAEQIDGYSSTENGWVQSYGSRYVRPPILYGDVKRSGPMTLRWTAYAQSLTERPVKGMLTGPVTMLLWSFVRDDQPLADTCRQLALAVRDEIADLEDAGVRVIQVDEAALREGLPARREAWPEYLAWAVECFRLATSGASDDTLLQTHVCYSEFGDIVEAIDELDADVALLWCARAGMRLLDDLRGHGYAREVGPGVWDIHSPRVPSAGEMADEIRAAVKRLGAERLWVNPDCGLKTRGWDETRASLRNMVEAAHTLREESGEA
ncbi:MAG TPA: 5-methyltetrahydropteroyltriglutamate--homocysteine S-methyltransferase [Acidimicrobiales bacterium]|jgi:5-methyltetrahydropteroyltriglutamate--homocysteine methyltransferase|nr:5-methyltetrahydropteroyltriglutamate--homocysteine S-methyltransferase [Acidimicrobiales bacterium]